MTVMIGHENAAFEEVPETWFFPDQQNKVKCDAWNHFDYVMQLSARCAAPIYYVHNIMRTPFNC